MTGPVGAVSYLNSKPLIFGLEERLQGRKLILDLPSRLADQLARRELDVALIPSVEFLRGDGLSIISDACIACRGPVRSVQLLFRKPPADVRTLALDEGSRTSCALSQVLLFQQFGIVPTLKPLPIAASLDSIDADALLVIGDRAMSLDTSKYVAAWDLGHEWTRMTGLPFVFAMWVANPIFDALESADELAYALRSARDEGLAQITSIIETEAPKYNLTLDNCRRYFESELHFFLGPEELAGLDLFRLQAAELSLVPATCTQLTLMPI
jgi:chorismate dehydratase